MLSLVLFILILGTIVLIHELGHFLFAKMFGVYVYEYSIGMGKKIFSKKPKNSETEYNIERKLYKKGFWERFLIFFMGPGFNMVLAFITFFVLCLIFGGSLTTLKMDNIENKVVYKQAYYIFLLHV